MGKILPIAGGIGLAALLGPEIAAAAPVTEEAAAGGLLGGGAFGSADMIAAGAAGGIPAATTAAAAEALPALQDPIIANDLEGVPGIDSVMKYNPYTGGYDNLSGIERIGQRLDGAMEDSHMPNLSKLFQRQQPAQPVQNAMRPATRRRQQVQLPGGPNSPYGSGGY